MLDQSSGRIKAKFDSKTHLQWCSTKASHTLIYNLVLWRNFFTISRLYGYMFSILRICIIDIENYIYELYISSWYYSIDMYGKLRFFIYNWTSIAIVTKQLQCIWINIAFRDDFFIWNNVLFCLDTYELEHLSSNLKAHFRFSSLTISFHVLCITSTKV